MGYYYDIKLFTYFVYPVDGYMILIINTMFTIAVSTLLFLCLIVLYMNNFKGIPGESRAYLNIKMVFILPLCVAILYSLWMVR